MRGVCWTLIPAPGWPCHALALAAGPDRPWLAPARPGWANHSDWASLALPARPGRTWLGNDSCRVTHRPDSALDQLAPALHTVGIYPTLAR